MIVLNRVEKLPLEIAASIAESTTPGCTVMYRTAAVGDGPARRASSAQTRSVWNLVPSYGCWLCTSCQSSASYASARDSSDDIHRTRAGPQPDRVRDAASCASSARHCSRRATSAYKGEEKRRWAREKTHDDIVPEHVALPCPPESVFAHYGSALDVEARMHRELERFEPARVLQELLEEQGPRDSQEWRHAGVAHEVRHVRVPITTARVFNIASWGERGRLTCELFRLKMRAYFGQTRGRASESLRRGSCGMLPRALPAVTRRPPRIAPTTACARPLLVADCGRP